MGAMAGGRDSHDRCKVCTRLCRPYSRGNKPGPFLPLPMLEGRAWVQASHRLGCAVCATNHVPSLPPSWYPEHADIAALVVITKRRGVEVEEEGEEVLAAAGEKESQRTAVERNVLTLRPLASLSCPPNIIMNRAILFLLRHTTISKFHIHVCMAR